MRRVSQLRARATTGHAHASIRVTHGRVQGIMPAWAHGGRAGGQGAVRARNFH